MPSLIAHSMKLFSRTYIRLHPKDADSLVAHLRRSMNHSPIPVMLPKGVSVEPWAEGALRGDRLRVAQPEKVILYLHGGGYVCGRTKTYFNFCSRLARELNAEVLLPAYRLAPEHPFPAAIDDAVAAYEHLLQQGWRPDQITIAGDSAGGGLTLGALLCLRDNGRPMPRCAVLISPFTDVRALAASVRGNDATDYMLGAAMLEVGRNVYAQTPLDAVHPYASPALGDFTGLPPLFITVCDHECLRDDAYAVEAKALAAGVPVTLLSRPDLFHVWPIFAPLLPEAREDLPRMANFIRGAGRNAHLRNNVVALNTAGAATLAAAAPAPAPAARTASAKAGTAKAGTVGAQAPAKSATAADGATSSGAATAAAATAAAATAAAAKKSASAAAPKAGAAASVPAGKAATGKTGKTAASPKPRKAPKTSKAEPATAAGKPVKQDKAGKPAADGKLRPRNLDKSPLAPTKDGAKGKVKKAG
ncbi:MAG: alpha/beta hydrolase [Pseudomonadota bacterium]